jgi:hypothetical protein
MSFSLKTQKFSVFNGIFEISIFYHLKTIAIVPAAPIKLLPPRLQSTHDIFTITIIPAIQTISHYHEFLTQVGGHICSMSYDHGMSAICSLNNHEDGGRKINIHNHQHVEEKLPTRADTQSLPLQCSNIKLNVKHVISQQ